VLVAACVGDNGGSTVIGDDASPGDGATAPDTSAADGGNSVDSGADANSASDAGTTTGTDSGTDAGVDAGPPCDTSKPWGAPILLSGTGINTGSQTDAHLTADEKVMLFYASDAGSTLAIYQSQRASLSSPFDMPVAATTLNVQMYNADPDLSADGLTVYFNAYNNGSPQAIYSATRQAIANAWSAPSAVTAVNLPNTNNGHPFITADKAELYFFSGAPAGGNYDIYRAAANGGGFATPADVTELATAFDDWKPVLSADRLRIFWASTRTDGGAKGDNDIWTATRANVSSPFSSIANVAELNTATYDAPSSLSPDGCRLYLTHGDNSGDNMYVATRPK
jgi:hypothetical protein